MSDTQEKTIFAPINLTPADCGAMLRFATAASVPVLMRGSPGIGKSDIVAQLCKDLYGDEPDFSFDRYYRDIRLAQMDQVDLRGIAAPDLARKLAVWLTPEFLPQDPDSEGIINWDELTSVGPEMQIVIYQAILDHRIGEYKFPEGWRHIACGNLDTDKAVVHKMSTALASRFLQIWMKVDVDQWCRWALANNVPTEIVAFVRRRPELLHQFDPKSPDKAFPCPRTWAMAGRLFQAMGQQAPALIQRAAYAGTVGKAASIELLSFLDMMHEVPDPRAILANPDAINVPDRPDVLLVTMMALARNVDRDTFGTGLSWCGKPGVPPELQAVFVHDAIEHRPDVQQTRAFQTFAASHSQHRL